MRAAGLPPTLSVNLELLNRLFYNWKRKYGDMNVSEVKRLKQLEAENAKLKELVADLSLDNKILKDVISKNS
jgi:putative transposase